MRDGKLIDMCRKCRIKLSMRGTQQQGYGNSLPKCVDTCVVVSSATRRLEIIKTKTGMSVARRRLQVGRAPRFCNSIGQPRSVPDLGCVDGYEYEGLVRIGCASLWKMEDLLPYAPVDNRRPAATWRWIAPHMPSSSIVATRLEYRGQVCK